MNVNEEGYLEVFRAIIACLPRARVSGSVDAIVDNKDAASKGDHVIHTGSRAELGN